jgi:predicted phosphoadenosine phosphosulfate sulfurtransferase
MSKYYKDKNVLDAAKERIEKCFDQFERIYVSFSGGKDSTVMLHLVMEEAIKRRVKVGVLFIDLEGQYKCTIDHVRRCYDQYKEHVEPFWVCLPIHLRNAVSTFQPFWKCWDSESKEAWIRDPEKGCITDPSFFPFFKDGMEFEEFVPEFGRWYGQGKPCCCFVGIRADESLNRFRTMANLNKKRHELGMWTTEVCPNVYNAYPVYDWKAEDLWTWHYQNPSASHNKLYDLMYKAGLTLSQMRICQPYGDDQRRGLWLFHLIEPETWNRVVARVNGANSGALYVQESGNITGYRRVSKPPHLNWQQFVELLMSSMPPKTQEHFNVKIGVFCAWWKTRGYPDGIPDEAPYELEAKKTVPSWRRVAKALLRNDFWCKGLSFTQHKSAAYEKYIQLKKQKLTRDAARTND